MILGVPLYSIAYDGLPLMNILARRCEQSGILPERVSRGTVLRVGVICRAASRRGVPSCAFCEKLAETT